MLKFGKMASLLTLLIIISLPNNCFSQSLKQDMVLTIPPPEGYRYDVISYMDINTGKQVWRIGLFEQTAFVSLYESIGIEGVAGGTSLIVLVLREVVNILLKRKVNTV